MHHTCGSCPSITFLNKSVLLKHLKESCQHLLSPCHVYMLILSYRRHFCMPAEVHHLLKCEHFTTVQAVLI